MLLSGLISPSGFRLPAVGVHGLRHSSRFWAVPWVPVLRRRITEIGQPSCCDFKLFRREQALPFWFQHIRFYREIQPLAFPQLGEAVCAAIKSSIPRSVMYDLFATAYGMKPYQSEVPLYVQPIEYSSGWAERSSKLCARKERGRMRKAVRQISAV